MRERQKGRADDVVMAALVWLMSSRLLAMLDPADDEPDDRTPWADMVLALRLGEWMQLMEWYDEIHGRRGTAKATKKRQQNAVEQLDALARALEAGEVQWNIDDVTRWRGEDQIEDKKKRRASRQRASRHLDEVRARSQTSKKK